MVKKTASDPIKFRLNGYIKKTPGVIFNSSAGPKGGRQDVWNNILPCIDCGGVGYRKRGQVHPTVWRCLMVGWALPTAKAGDV